MAWIAWIRPANLRFAVSVSGDGSDLRRDLKQVYHIVRVRTNFEDLSSCTRWPALTGRAGFEAVYLVKPSSDSAELAMKAMGLAITLPTSPELMTN